eukprot:m.1466912 g.1466912  ORF g.1466912 m.1466912 type:complete len:55 (-) comp25138_c0_seq20:1651-1815(-)
MGVHGSTYPHPSHRFLNGALANGQCIDTAGRPAGATIQEADSSDVIESIFMDME